MNSLLLQSIVLATIEGQGEAIDSVHFPTIISSPATCMQGPGGTQPPTGFEGERSAVQHPVTLWTYM